MGLAAQGVFDGRDTTFTPSRGQLVRVELWRHDTSFGGDFDYWKFPIEAGQEIKLYLWGMDGDYDLALLDPNGILNPGAVLRAGG